MGALLPTVGLMFDSFRARWSRFSRWPRLLAAGTCLLLALFSALGAAHDRAAARRPERTVPVVVAVHPLAAGHVLRAADLRVEHWPTALHPPATPAGPAALVGRRCAGAVSAREPLTAARVLGAGIVSGLAAGLGAVPIELAGGGRTAEYVRPGDHVDVLAGPADTAAGDDGGADPTVVAGDAVVLGVLPGSDGTAAVVIIGADRSTALRVARQQSTRTFTVVVVSP